MPAVIAIITAVDTIIKYTTFHICTREEDSDCTP